MQLFDPVPLKSLKNGDCFILNKDDGYRIFQVKYAELIVHKKDDAAEYIICSELALDQTRAFPDNIEEKEAIILSLVSVIPIIINAPPLPVV